jgi:cyclic dehypoxanthinyl futalosine synthase
MQSFTLESVAQNKHRLTLEQGIYALEHMPWTELVQAANEMRNHINTPGVVSYTAYRMINYTNVCNVGCSFCSFMEEAASGKGYTLSLDTIRQKGKQALELGIDGIFLQGGVNLRIPLQYYLDALQILHFEQGLQVRGFSPVELYSIARHYKMDLNDLVQQFKESGLGSVPGAGAEIMTPRMREVLAPRKLSAQDWCHVMTTCQQAGLPGSANIVIGSSEQAVDIVQHLQYIRDVQDVTGGFLTFVPWVFQPRTQGFPIRHVAGVEYLKVLALSRLFLENIQHIEVSVLGMGKELGELGLYAGADDINSIVIEENVLENGGIKSIAEAEQYIQNAGFTPKRRTMNFAFYD